MRSPGETLLAIHLSEIAGTTWTTEHAFHPERNWRFDFAEESLKIAIEIDGGIYSGGRHVRPKGFEKDLEKLNEAARLGWRVLRFPTGSVMNGRAKAMIASVVDQIRAESAGREGQNG